MLTMCKIDTFQATSHTVLLKIWDNKQCGTCKGLIFFNLKIIIISVEIHVTNNLKKSMAEQIRPVKCIYEIPWKVC